MRGTLAALRTIRVRTTLAAAVIVAVAMGAGGLLLMGALRSGLLDNVEQGAEQRAEEIIEALDSGGPEPLLAALDDDEEFVQVVVDGEVTAATANVLGRMPIARAETADGRFVADVPLDGEIEELLIVAEDADGDGRSVVVIVGRSLEDVGETIETVRSLLWIGGPVLVGVVVMTTWFVVGLALRPVERMRREVDDITFSDMGRRVAAPETGDEIARLATTMNAMLGRLDAGQERQRRFVADASHELRTPVATLRQHAEVNLAHPDDVSGVPLADVVLAESIRMQRLVDDLLLLARADEGSVGARRRPVDVDDIVFDEASRLRAGAHRSVDTTGVGAGRVEGDEPALRRVVRNLADNAARHSHGAVAFALYRQDGDIVLVVDDDGPGIAVSDRDRVLERFVRLDEGRGRDDGGTGLGLAIVHEVVAAHGGTIVIGDSPLGGARISVRLAALSC